MRRLISRFKELNTLFKVMWIGLTLFLGFVFLSIASLFAIIIFFSASMAHDMTPLTPEELEAYDIQQVEREANLPDKLKQSEPEQRYQAFFAQHESAFGLILINLNKTLDEFESNASLNDELADYIAELQDLSKQVVEYPDVPDLYADVHAEYTLAMGIATVMADELAHIPELDANSIEALTTIESVKESIKQAWVHFDITLDELMTILQ